MAFWNKWFQSAPASGGKPAATLDYKGYVIEAWPKRDGGQYQLAGVITLVKDGATRQHEFVRADRCSALEDAAELALLKGRLIVDQLGEGMFR